MKFSKYSLWLAIILMAIGSCQQFFVNSGRVTSIVATVFFLLLAYNIRKQKKERSALIILVFLNAIGIFYSVWLTWAGTGLFNFLLGLVSFIYLYYQLLCEKKQWFKKIFSVVIFFFVLVIGGLFSITTVFPNEVMKWVRTDYFHNENVTSAKQTNTKLKDGTKVTRDVQYDSQDINGYLDIYHTTKGNKNPETFVYIHGGGYIWGDKQGGDPTSGDVKFKDSTISRMVDAGYNVVSYNYALAPDVSFPTAILQLNRGLDFINQNAEKYNLNMNKVILGGGSAGGNLAGVLTNIQTNPEYAKAINTSPVLKKDQIKAVFFQGGAADNSKIGITESAIIDWMFYNVGRVYLESNNLYESEFLTKSNVTDYVTSDFPPVFISDGNKGTPYGQNFVLYSKFQELGVESKLSYFHKEYAGPLGHGFDEFGGKYADISMENLIEFLQTNVREKS